MGFISKAVAKYGTKFKANSPTLLLGGGIVLLIGTGISAHRAGRKVDEVLDVSRTQLDNLKEIKEAGEYVDDDGETVEFTEKDYKKEVTHTYVSTAADLGKLYLPVIGFGAASVACFVGGHKIMAERLTGMTLAYKASQAAYQRYRQNVIEAEGLDADNRYLYGLTQVEETYKDTKIDEKTGEVKEIGRAKVRQIDAVKDVGLWNQASPYAIRLDSVKGFTSDPQYNVMWLEHIENLANNMLDFKGYLTLYDVYDALGVVPYISTEVEKMSHQVGWVKGRGDGDIRFKLLMVPTACAFIEGETQNISEVGLIDFNCIGSIWDCV